MLDCEERCTKARKCYLYTRNSNPCRTLSRMELDPLFDAVTKGARRGGRALIAAYSLWIVAADRLRMPHLPTCSVYGDEALERFGLWAGGWMTLGRLCRCHPLGTSVSISCPRRCRSVPVGTCPGAMRGGAASTTRPTDARTPLRASTPCQLCGCGGDPSCNDLNSIKINLNGTLSLESLNQLIMSK